ncbi:MAG: hypothetical protein A3H23_00550 [Planctomycetes bacterium RIFCSPLOWO2_12_FULL_40_19]|nr:MAG: hypothetical protein A3H23_00550 [Planctomycetes bacterium RIFCSPLOWO2_12_FULL_40_19]
MVKSIDVSECGLLDGFLSRKRAKRVNKLIPHSHRSGKILDIGCGMYPYFLLNTDFSEKHGLDRVIVPNASAFSEKLCIKDYDLEKELTIPYADNSFDVLTMLAVFEHFDKEKLILILREVKRVLKPGGVFILTVPAGWTDKLLTIMAKFKLVSASLFNEHKDTYTHKKIVSLLQTAGFQKEKMHFGYFEIFMNLWVKVTK